MRVASRFMLPSEILLGWMTVVVGIAGGWGDGRLHQLLAARGECTMWAVTFMSLGGAAICVAGVEWVWLRTASQSVIMWVTRVRSTIAFAGAVLWAAATGWLVADGLAFHTIALLMLAPAAMLFYAWTFWENQKVAYATDPEHPTSRLVFHR